MPSLDKFKDLEQSAQEFKAGVEQLKQSLEAIWNSIGVLSGRIVEVEAAVDSLK